MPDTAAVGSGAPEKVILAYDSLIPTVAQAVPVAHALAVGSPGDDGKHPELLSLDAVFFQASAAPCVSTDQVPFLFDCFISAVTATKPHIFFVPI